MVEEAEAKIFLVKTSHVSGESVERAKNAIKEINPDIVGVELDINRYKALKEEKDRKKSFLGILKGNIFLGILQKLLSSFQSSVGKDIGIEPGSEMLEAIEVAKENNIPITFLDRNIKITMQRMWNKMALTEKLKMFGALILGLLGFGRKKVDLDKITQEDNVDFLIEEFRKFSPGAAEALIDERDAYISAKILSQAMEGKKIVAIIGAGHEKGITEYLKNSQKIPNIRKLEKV